MAISRRPVDHRAHLAILLAHGGDVLEGPDGGVDVVPDGGVLGGQTEGVEPHREEDVVAAHALQRAKTSGTAKAYQWPMCSTPEG